MLWRRRGQFPQCLHRRPDHLDEFPARHQAQRQQSRWQRRHRREAERQRLRAPLLGVHRRQRRRMGTRYCVGQPRPGLRDWPDHLDQFPRRGWLPDHARRSLRGRLHHEDQRGRQRLPLLHLPRWQRHRSGSGNRGGSGACRRRLRDRRYLVHEFAHQEWLSAHERRQRRRLRGEGGHDQDRLGVAPLLHLPGWQRRRSRTRHRHRQRQRIRDWPDRIVRLVHDLVSTVVLRHSADRSV